MPVADVKVDLAHLAARVRAVADALKRVRADQGLCAKEKAALCEEVSAVVAELRGNQSGACSRSAASKVA